MWTPCINNNNRSQGIPPWFLLADCASRNGASGEALQRLSAIQSKESPSSVSTQDNPNNMVVCSMGAGHGWAIQDGQRRLDPSPSRSRQIHQVDRSTSDQEA